MHLHSTRLQIEKFVYSKGTNVALYNAEHSTRYKGFEEAVQKALMSQINAIADYKNVLPLLMVLAKIKVNATAELLSQVSVLINKDPLSDKIDLSSYLVWAGTQGGQAFFDKTGINATFSLKDENLIIHFNDYSQLIIDSVDDYTKQWIATKIQDGKVAGLTPFEIQESLIDDGKGITALRAERIVLTETAKAMGTIELAAAKRNNIQEKIWRTSLDERVCPICSPLEGQRKDLADNFSIDVSAPPAHVSCRCYFEDVIPDSWELPAKLWIGE